MQGDSTTRASSWLSEILGVQWEQTQQQQQQRFSHHAPLPKSSRCLLATAAAVARRVTDVYTTLLLQLGACRRHSSGCILSIHRALRPCSRPKTLFLLRPSSPTWRVRNCPRTDPADTDMQRLCTEQCLLLFTTFRHHSRLVSCPLSACRLVFCDFSLHCKFDTLSDAPMTRPLYLFSNM